MINIRLLPVILGCLLLMACPAYPQPPFGPEGLITPFITRQPQFRSGISLDEAIQRIRRETGGRILAADTVRNDGAVTYRIKVLMPNGRVRVFYVDAEG
ncbi:PepSY domain-containing protein [Methylocaldum sp.]|uniref:PepSY domain-containing protein n=1 Tax=Methylocaldum sp. TaxID=1969727 RepID=UPI002D2F1F0B|nr:PepSY domain-containing protein [Methylocaldum sp.]HYE37965.1 PepSY domain-containing protein [Methylocaldum sp.]